MEANASVISVFSNTYDLKSLIKEPTCLRTPINLLALTLFSQINHKVFCVIKTGLSDFHKMIVTVTKKFFEKLQLRVVNYRDYKYFENN